MIKKISDDKKVIVSNFFSLTILQLANYLLPLIIIPFLVRVLGIDKFGLVMFAQSIATFLMIAVDFGFEISGTREISMHRNQKREISQIFSAIMSIKLILIVFWFSLLFLVVELIPRLKADALVYYLSFGLVIGQAIFPVWFFQGIEKMKFVSGINILAKIIFTLLIFVVIKEESDYYLVPAFNSIGYIIAGVLGLVLGLKKISFVVPKIDLMKKLFQESFSLFLGKLSTNLYTTCNVLILGAFTGNTVVGVFSSMEKLILAIKNIFVPLYQALFPWLSNQEPIKRIKVLKSITPYILGAGVIITLVILIFGEQILTLIYNDALISSYAIIFRIFSLVAVFASLNMMFISLYFPAIKMYKIRMYILMISGIVHLFISLLAVKLFGIYGIATTVVFTEFLILILAYRFFRKQTFK